MDVSFGMYIFQLKKILNVFYKFKKKRSLIVCPIFYILPMHCNVFTVKERLFVLH